MLFSDRRLSLHTSHTCIDGRVRNNNKNMFRITKRGRSPAMPTVYFQQVQAYSLSLVKQTTRGSQHFDEQNAQSAWKGLGICCRTDDSKLTANALHRGRRTSFLLPCAFRHFPVFGFLCFLQSASPSASSLYLCFILPSSSSSVRCYVGSNHLGFRVDRLSGPSLGPLGFYAVQGMFGHGCD